jgi:hypothetical protein
MDLRSIVVDSSPSISAAAGVGFRVSFQAYDDNWEELFAPEFLPGATDTPGLGINAIPVFAPVVSKAPVSGSVSKGELARLVYADGTPYQGVARKFGCTFVGITSIPQGQSFNTAVSGGGGRNANQQWQSVPYMVTAEDHTGVPVMVEAPTVLNTPPDNEPTSSVELVASTGQWKNVHSMQYSWLDCGPDKYCHAPIERAKGSNKVQVGIGAIPDSEFATGDYMAFQVIVQSATGGINAYRTTPQLINGPPAPVGSPYVIFTEGGTGYASFSAQQSPSVENEYIFRYETTDYECAAKGDPSLCTWQDRGVNQHVLPEGGGVVTVTNQANSRLVRDTQGAGGLGRVNAVRVSIEAKARSQSGAVTSKTYYSPVYLGYSAPTSYNQTPIF